MKDETKEFFKALGYLESRENYEIRNKYGYIGKYQMGEAAMIDAGYYIKKLKPGEHFNNDWSGSFTGKNGIYSVDDFLKNHEVQEIAQVEFKQKQWKYLENDGASKYLGQSINGIKITQSGLLGGAHIGGQGKVLKFLKSNGKIDETDANKVPVSTYIRKLKDYDVSEITGLPDDSTINRYSDSNQTNEKTIEQEQKLSKRKSSNIQNKEPINLSNKVQKSENGLKDKLVDKLENLKNMKYSLSKLLKFLKDNNFSFSNILNSIKDAEGLNIDKPKNEQSNMHSIDDASKEELEINKDVTSKTEPEDDGLVIIPDKYKDKPNGEDADEPQLPYEKRVEIKAYSPDGELIKESNDSEEQEPEINPEYLKPIELEEDGTSTGGAAGISDKFVNPNVYNKDSAEYPETSLGDDELSMPSEKKKFDFIENSMKELMKHTKRFSYDANAGKLDSISLINRKLDKINKTLESMQQQLDYHEKVVNIYNTPELAEFYLNRPVRNIMASVFEDYCIMEGIPMSK